MAFVLLVIAIIVPVIALIFIVRALATIVDGLRSINATTMRIADSLDEMNKRSSGVDHR